KLVALNQTINWKPEATGSGRFGNWLENLVDWNLSRSRYWGTPLPIWRSTDENEEICVGSLPELKSLLQAAIQSDALSAEEKAIMHLYQNKFASDALLLHCTYIDDIVIDSHNEIKIFHEPYLIHV